MALPLIFPLPNPRKSAHLIEIKNQVQLTHVPKEAIQHLNEEVDRLQISQLVVVRVHAGAEEEPRVSAVDNLVVAELHEVGLVLLVARGYEAMDLGWGVSYGLGKVRVWVKWKGELMGGRSR
jgi:hypothetical protein